MSLIKLRVVAVKTLAQVLHSSLSLDDAMLSELNRTSAQTKPEFDRAWIYEICSGVLRYKGRLDFIIDTYALKKKPSGPMRRYLYTGVYQLLAQETQAALIVSETVQAVRDEEGEAPSKFVNAILRKVSEAKDHWRSWDITEQCSKEEQAAWCSLPEWIFKKMIKQYGFDFTKAYALENLNRPVTWYRKLSTAIPLKLEDGYQGTEEPGFVQDISNQNLVNEVHAVLSKEFSKAIDLGNKPKVLDLCSAPGGKSLGLAALGWQMIATDRDEVRLSKVRENKARLKMTDEQIDIISFDKIFKSDEKFPVIWLDVPCMSIGIIRRHPEVKWNRQEKDLPVMMQKQKELIVWAVQHLTAEGILIYSSCSPLKEENPSEVKGCSLVKSLDFFPQNDPFGDCILARIFTHVKVAE